MSSRPLAVAVVLCATVAVLGSCTDDEPEPEPRAEPTVSVDQAQQEYSPLVTDVVASLADASGTPGRETNPEVIWFDSELGSCMYASTRYEFAAVFGEDVTWDDVRAATEQVVDDRGFELTEQLDIPGGHNGFDAVADDGARFQVRSKLGNPSTIDLDAPVTGSCPGGNGSQTLPPLE